MRKIFVQPVRKNSIAQISNSFTPRRENVVTKTHIQYINSSFLTYSRIVRRRRRGWPAGRDAVRAFEALGPFPAVEAEDALRVATIKVDVTEHDGSTVGAFDVVDVVGIWAREGLERRAALRRIERGLPAPARQHCVIGCREVHRAWSRGLRQPPALAGGGCAVVVVRQEERVICTRTYVRSSLISTLDQPRSCAKAIDQM